jgi:hypothetical protein
LTVSTTSTISTKVDPPLQLEKSSFVHRSLDDDRNPTNDLAASPDALQRFYRW